MLPDVNRILSLFNTMSAATIGVRRGPAYFNQDLGSYPDHSVPGVARGPSENVPGPDPKCLDGLGTSKRLLPHLTASLSGSIQ